MGARTTLACLAALGVAPAALAAGGHTTRTCEDPGGPVATPRADRDVTVGPISLLEARGVAQPSVRRGHAVWKLPVLVAAGARVRVSVRRADHGRVSLAGPSAGTQTLRSGLHAVTFVACRDDRPRSGFPWAVQTRSRKLCLRLVVRHGGRTRTAALALGRPAAGCVPSAP